MDTRKKLILSRATTALLIAILTFLLGGSSPSEAQETKSQDDNYTRLHVIYQYAPDLSLSQIELKINEIIKATGEDRHSNTNDNRADKPGDRTVRVGIYQNPPKIFIDEKDLPSGIFVDLLEEIAGDEKWNLIYVPCEWSECLEALEEHRIDLMPDVAYSRERDQKYDFHDTAVVDSWSQVYANSSIPVSTLSDLDGRRIAVLKKGIQEKIFEEMMRGFGFDVTLVEAETYSEAFMLTKNGYSDAVISNYLIGDYLFRRYGLTKTPIVFNPTSLYFATAQGKNPELLDAVERHLNAWRGRPDSLYYQTLSRWMERSPEKVVPRYLIWIMVVTGAFLIVSVGVIYLLRAQVSSKTGHLVRANEALRESEEKYRLLVENLNDVIFCLDAEGNIIYLNPVASSMFAYRPEEIIGRSFADFIHPDDLSGVIESRRETLGGVLNPYEFRMVDKNGSIHHVRTSSRSIEKDGQHAGITGVLTDITRERQAEEALRKFEQKHRTILDTIEDGYFEVDLKGSFTAFNESMRRMLGYSRKEMVGLNNRQYMSKDIAKKVFLAFNEIFRTGTPAKTVDWRLVRKDGTTIDIETSISLKRDDSGLPIGFFGIARDVTDKKKMELQLLQTEKLSTMGTMISGVAHELNNPLTSIIGISQLISKRDVSDDIKDKLNIILRESIRSSKIVGGLLAFAREHKPERRMININDIMIESIKLREYDFKVGNIDLRASLSDELPETYADPYQIQQVFINLINNARDALAGRKKCSLVLRTYSKNGVVIIEFEDTGPGIPDEIINKIFDPFFTTKKIGEGTGLGLSMAYGIIKEHDGTISVVSKPGKGAKFTVTIPITQGVPSMAEEEAPPLKLPSDAKTVLVVEDEESLRDLIVEALADKGLFVESTSNGEEAVRLIEVKPYDAVISDIKMPGMGGRELYLYVQRHHPILADRIIFITGDVLSRDTQAFLKITNNRFIEKPFNIDDLVYLLNDVLQ